MDRFIGKILQLSVTGALHITVLDHEYGREPDVAIEDLATVLEAFPLLQGEVPPDGCHGAELLVARDTGAAAHIVFAELPP